MSFIPISVLAEWGSAAEHYLEAAMASTDVVFISDTEMEDTLRNVFVERPIGTDETLERVFYIIIVIRRQRCTKRGMNTKDAMGGHIIEFPFGMLRVGVEFSFTRRDVSYISAPTV